MKSEELRVKYQNNLKADSFVLNKFIIKYWIFII